VNMSFMFNYASSFNQDIGNWDVKHVTDMQWMFNYAPVFNQDIGNWNVSNVINMTAMLHGASSFNRDIGNWDVSSVTNMASMFNNASLFNQDISDWDVSNVVHMTEMFRSSSSFNQDLSDWDINSAAHMEGMFYNSLMSCENYRHTLQGWANNPNIASNVTFSNQTGRSFSPDVITARNYLMNTKGWAISGDTQGASRIACQTPVNLTVDNLTSNSAKLIWESNESVFEIEWGTAGFTQGNGTIVSSITTLFYELDNLQPNTEYEFYVRSDCGSIYSDWAGPKEFRTSLSGYVYEENGTYKASEDVVAGNFYEYNGDWFYVAINRADLKSKTDLWNNAAYSNNPNRALLITGLNGTYSIPVNHIVTTRVTDMGGIFSEASNFNQDIGSWDLSHVVNMSFMFNYASSFNQDIGNWDVKHVTDMQWMFNYAPVFNQDIGNWNVSNVINMTAMLHGASSFNQDIGNWDVSSVTNMTSMFNNASLF